jgi:hypothetical protein
VRSVMILKGPPATAIRSSPKGGADPTVWLNVYDAIQALLRQASGCPSV